MSVSLGSLIYNLPAERRKSVRELEKISTKIIKEKCSLLFNSTCLKEQILPKYTNIKLHDQAARNEHFTLKYRRQLVEREVENAKASIETLEKDHKERTTSLLNTMDEQTITPILQKIQENVATIEIETKLKQSRKLNSLYGRSLVLPTEKRDAFVNLSSYELSASEKEFLIESSRLQIQRTL